MGILDWLRHVSEGGDGHADLIAQQPLRFEAGEEQFQGLNMKEALDAHMAWTLRMERRLRGEDAGDYRVADIAVDDNCVLGKWLHGPAQRHFGHLPEYGQLRKAHVGFHLIAGQLFSDIDSNAVTDPGVALKTLRRASGEVQLALIRLYAAARQT